jgi:hypothetical protein
MATGIREAWTTYQKYEIMKTKMQRTAIALIPAGELRLVSGISPTTKNVESVIH